MEGLKVYEKRMSEFDSRMGLVIQGGAFEAKLPRFSDELNRE